MAPATISFSFVCLFVCRPTKRVLFFRGQAERPACSLTLNEVDGDEYWAPSVSVQLRLPLSSSFAAEAERRPHHRPRRRRRRR